MCMNVHDVVCMDGRDGVCVNVHLMVCVWMVVMVCVWMPASCVVVDIVYTPQHTMKNKFTSSHNKEQIHITINNKITSKHILFQLLSKFGF